MTAWPVAVWTLLPALAIPVIAALRGTVATRLVAAQLAMAIGILILVAMSFAFDQDSYISLALTLAVLNVPGTVVLAMFVERWL